MKKGILLLACFLFMRQAFSQDTTQPVLTKADYLRKSRASKTAAWILLGGGIGMFVAGAATYQVEIDLAPLFGGAPSSSHVDNTGSTLLVLGGLGAIVGSIVSFSVAKHNKKQAAAFSFSNQHILLPQQRGLSLTAQPTLRLTIPL